MTNEKEKQLRIGIVLILLSAVMTCSGQLCWKLGAMYTEYTILLYLIGFGLYGMGALLMMIAFRFGEMSILHPMLSVGFIGALILGKVFLDEVITIKSFLGVVLILIGICLLSRQKNNR